MGVKDRKLRDLKRFAHLTLNGTLRFRTGESILKLYRIRKQLAKIKKLRSWKAAQELLSIPIPEENGARVTDIIHDSLPHVINNLSIVFKHRHKTQHETKNTTSKVSPSFSSASGDESENAKCYGKSIIG